MTVEPPLDNVRELHKSSVKEALEHVLKAEAQIEGVIILTLNKDGSQFMAGSRLSMHQMSFMKCFFDAFIGRWFNNMENLNGR